MRRLIVLGVLFAAGCGAQVGLALAGPEAERLTPTQQTDLQPGTYVGMVLCDAKLREGRVVNQTTVSISRSVTFSRDGLPIREGREISSGSIFLEQIAIWSITDVVDRVTVSENAVLIKGHALLNWDCENTCLFAFDHVCQEVLLCSLGTDCSDCGPVVLEGLYSQTLQAIDAGRLRYSFSLFVLEEDAGLASMAMECNGVLTR